MTQLEGYSILCHIIFKDYWPVFFEEDKLRLRPALARCIYMLQTVFNKQKLNFQKSNFNKRECLRMCLQVQLTS